MPGFTSRHSALGILIRSQYVSASEPPCVGVAETPITGPMLQAHHKPSTFHHIDPIPNQIAMLRMLVNAPSFHQVATGT